MFEKIGFLITCIGAMMGDSECLLIPAVVVALGLGLVVLGFVKGGNDETA